MTREDKFALGMAFAIASATIVYFASRGAFAGNKGTPGVPDPTPKIPVPTPDLPKPLGPPPVHADPLAGIEAADVPDEIVAGGVPMTGNWAQHSWYSYRGLWIRVDVSPDVDSDAHHPHGVYRWVVIAGDATPLATWTTESLPEFGQVVTFNDENTDWVAGKAAEWVDELLAAGG